jgi:hypothetical protein
MLRRTGSQEEVQELKAGETSMDRDDGGSGRLEAGRDRAHRIDSAGGAERGNLMETTTGREQQIGWNEIL